MYNTAQIEQKFKGHRMYSIIVLGLIPGTNISVSFQVWLLVVAAGVLVSIPVLYRIYKNQTEIWLPSHYPKDANQLHQRGV